MMHDDRAASDDGDGAPELLGSRIAYDGFVKVRVDTVRLPSGREAAREVVEHPGAVAILALTEDDHVLLVRQWRQAAGRSLLEVPAGTREPDESPEATARRELLEEVGHVPAALTELATFYPSPGYAGERITLFRADGCRPVDRPPDPDEGLALIRVPVAAVPDLFGDTARSIVDGKTLVALLWLLCGGGRRTAVQGAGSLARLHHPIG